MPDDIGKKFEIVKQLTELFKFERRVYLAITIISFIMLAGSALKLIIKGQAGYGELSMLFGSSGLITFTANRLLFMWNEALKRLMPSNGNKDN